MGVSLGLVIALIKKLGGGGGSGGVSDVKVNGTSVVSQGVAEIPIAGSSDPGVVKINPVNGIAISNTSHSLHINGADDNDIKSFASNYKPIVPPNQHKSVFYGMAKAAGDSTQASSNNAVGVYTEVAKKKIQNMLGVAGSGGFELIKDITIEEATTRLFLDTDDNGGDFKLDAVNVFIDVPIGTASAMNGSFYCDGTTTAADEKYLWFRFPNFIHASFKAHHFISMSLLRYGFVNANALSKISTSSYLNSIECDYERYNANYISAFCLENASVPEGTKIKIWGHRIPE